MRGPVLRGAHPGATATELPGDDHVLISRRLARRARRRSSASSRRSGRRRAWRPIACWRRSCSPTSSVPPSGPRPWAIAPGATSSSGITLAVRRELARSRGREIDTAGDGFFAAFDGPARAIRCAVAIRDALADLGLDVRIGLHAGECERVGAAARRGRSRRRAHRRSAAAGRDPRHRAPCATSWPASGIGFEDAGIHELKGVPEPWQLYRVVDALTTFRRARFNPDRIRR